MQVVVGRGFVAEEHTPGRNGVAILDHGFCQRAFSGDEDAIGQTVSIGGASYSIIGVLAREARLPDDIPRARLPSDADAYLPIAYDEAFSARRRTNRSIFRLLFCLTD